MHKLLIGVCFVLGSSPDQRDGFGVSNVKCVGDDGSGEDRLEYTMSFTDLSAFVEGLFIDYGYLALLGIFILEGAMLLYFAPSESLVPGAIYLLTGHSPFEIAVVIGVAAVGATIGQTALFLFAKRGGRDRLFEHRWVRISEDRLDRFDRWFDRWGTVSVVVSNALPFTRGMCTIPAGLARLDTRQFILSSAIGTVAFESALALLTLGVLQIL